MAQYYRIHTESKPPHHVVGCGWQRKAHEIAKQLLVFSEKILDSDSNALGQHRVDHAHCRLHHARDGRRKRNALDALFRKKPEPENKEESNKTNKTDTLTGGDTQNKQEEIDTNENQNTIEEEMLQYVPASDPVYKSNLDLYTYDVRPGKTLTYQEVCNLTLNIARSQLQNIIRKDESVLFAESREKNRLITELNKYLKNSEIANKLNLQPDNLSIPQLQQSLDQAKDLYETIKVTHVIEKGLDLFNLGYTYIFPNGIKIPNKNKAIKLNGVAGSFKQLLFSILELFILCSISLYLSGFKYLKDISSNSLFILYAPI